MRGRRREAMAGMRRVMADAASRPAALPAPHRAGCRRAGSAGGAPRAPPGIPQPQPRPHSRPRPGAALTHLLRAAAEREKREESPRPPPIAAPGRTRAGCPRRA